jgi:hypothetical protein
MGNGCRWVGVGSRRFMLVNTARRREWIQGEKRQQGVSVSTPLTLVFDGVIGVVAVRPPSV